MKAIGRIHSIKQLPFLVMGMSDGLTLPLALMGGLLGSKAGAETIILAGSGVTFLGAIITAIGAYNAAKDESFDTSRQLKNRERNKRLLHAIDIDPTLEEVEEEDAWKEITEREKDKNTTPPPQAALTVACAYLLGGAFVLIPFLLWKPLPAFIISVSLTCCLLFSLGYIKGFLAQSNRWLGGITLLLIGILAIGSAYFVGFLFR